MALGPEGLSGEGVDSPEDSLAIAFFRARHCLIGSSWGFWKHSVTSSGLNSSRSSSEVKSCSIKTSTVFSDSPTLDAQDRSSSAANRRMILHVYGQVWRWSKGHQFIVKSDHSSIMSKIRSEPPPPPSPSNLPSDITLYSTHLFMCQTYLTKRIVHQIIRGEN